jgi:hypothetical protein
MTPGSGRFLRDNAFLVAAVSLPLVVVAFFLLSSIIPRWLVPPPTHDVLVRGDVGYDNPTVGVAVDFNVRDGRVEATVRPRPAGMYRQHALFLIDHATMTARQVPLDLPPSMAENDPPRTFVIEALADRRVFAQPISPDGYRLEHRNQRGPGLVGDVFGMNRYQDQATLVNRGRVARITMLPPYQYLGPVQVIGWFAPGLNDGQR